MKIGFASPMKIKYEREEVYTKEGDKEKVSRRTYLNTFEYAMSNLGVPGILAIMVFTTICTIVIFQSVRGIDVEIPQFFPKSLL